MNQPAPKKPGLGVAVWSLIVVVVVLLLATVTVFALGGFSGDSRWTAECNERAGNAYNIGHPYSRKEIAKACVDRAEEIEGLGDSDSQVREILDEFGPLNK